MSQSSIASTLPTASVLNYVSHNDVRKLSLSISRQQVKEHKITQMESCADILVRSVSDLLDTPYETLRGIRKTRKREVTDAKACIQAVADQIIGSIFADVYTHSWLAGYMNCDHATINSRKKKHSNLMERNKGYQDLYKDIIAISSSLTVPGSDLYATMDIRALVARRSAIDEVIKKWEVKLKEQGKYYDYDSNTIKKIHAAQADQAE